MRDIVKNINLRDINNDDIKLHGEVSIQLKNPITGSIAKEIKSENTFQSAIVASYLRSLGQATVSPYTNDTFKSNPFYVNVVGGIFLFRDTIQVGSSYMPAGNRMIGNGSYGFNNGASDTDPLEMGSFNANESGATGSAITQVYEYTTGQSNGQIGCVCLTSQVGGFIGYGNGGDLSRVESSRFRFNSNQSKAFTTISGPSTSYYYSFVEGNYLYTLSIADKIATITKTQKSITQGSVFEDFLKTSYSFDLDAIGNHHGIVGSQMLEQSQDGNCFYFINANYASGYVVAPSDYAYVYKFDTSDNTLVELAILNTTNKYMRFESGGGYYRQQWAVRCGKLFVNLCDTNVVAEGVLGVLDISTGVHDATISQVTFPASWQSIPTSGSVSPGIVIMGDYLYDVVSKQCYKHNAYNDNSGSYVSSTDTINYINDNRNITVYHSPVYLATINNLNIPVTKTAAQTMKVTYTLTEL